MLDYKKSNQIGVVTQLFNYLIKIIYYYLILKYFDVEFYGENVFYLTVAGFGLLFADSGISEALFIEADKNENSFNQYFTISFSLSFIITIILILYGISINNEFSSITYIIGISIPIFNLKNFFVKVLQKYEEIKFHAYTNTVYESIRVLLCFILLKFQFDKYALYLPGVISGLFTIFIISRYVFKRFNFKPQPVTWNELEVDKIHISTKLLITKISNYFVVNWIFLFGLIDFRSLAYLNLASGIWSNVSTGIKHTFQRNYILLPLTSRNEVQKTNLYLWKFNIKYLIPIVLVSSIAIFIILEFFEAGKWKSTNQYYVCYLIYGIIYFSFPAVTPVFIRNNRIQSLMTNSIVFLLFSVLILLYILYGDINLDGITMLSLLLFTHLLQHSALLLILRKF